MGILNWDDLDRKVGFLNLAQEHGLVLTQGGDTLRMTLRMTQAVAHEDPDLDTVHQTLGAKKADVLAIMKDDAAVREWLARAQKELVNLNNRVNDMMDRWINIEKMYLSLHPDRQECVCSPSICPDDAVITCMYCVHVNSQCGARIKRI